MPSTTEGPTLPPLASHRIPHLPSSFHYIPNFLTPSEETQILENISAGTWIHLSKRKLQVYPAQLTAKNVLLSNTSLPQWLKNPIVDRFAEFGVFDSSSDNEEEQGHGAPNHTLINAYEPGQGIMPHEDGPAYFPIVATVSLGAPIVLEIYTKNEAGEREENPKWRILQEERSLLVTKGAEAYGGLLHGIREVDVDEELRLVNEDEERGNLGIVNWELLGDRQRFKEGKLERKTRVSLTYRDVRKVSSLGNRLFGGKR